MKRLTKLILVLIIVLLTATTVAAKATSVTLVERIDPAEIGQDLLQNSCTEEWIQLEGTFLLMTHTTVDDTGKMHVKGLTNPQGMVATGLTSGDRYLPVGAGGFRYSEAPDGFPFQVTFSNNVVFVKPGSGVSLIENTTYHLTINANGEATVDSVHMNWKCGPGS
jgi:hypothetical protein